MKPLDNLRAILHSKRANLYYLEYCRVMQKDGRVLYLLEAKNENQYWNIPIANTTVILLGNGTSITQAAMRMLSSAGVIVGFTGGGGTPLHMGAEVEWFSSQSEYRPTEYMQGWMKFWFDENKRLEVAKKFQCSRLNFIEQVWIKDRDLKEEGFLFENINVQKAIASFSNAIGDCQNVGNLLLSEANMTKQLYKFAALNSNISGFNRDPLAKDLANKFLTHGNYLAYGLAATVLWVLGISYSFAVMHGKTRRGALVFDIADLIKDAIVLPWSFICAKEKVTEQAFRELIIQKFTEHKVLDRMFNEVKFAALNNS